MATLNKAAFDKIVTAAEEFVNKQRGKWGEDEWRDLLSILKQLGVDLNDETQAYVRQLLEAMRGVYEATGSTAGMTKALTSATKGSVEFVKVHKAIWGYADWEDFADHIRENTKVVSKETADYLSDILEALKALVSKRAAGKSTTKKKAAKPAASKPAAKPTTRAKAPAAKAPAEKAPAAKKKPKAAAQKPATKSAKTAPPTPAAKPAPATPKPAAKKTTSKSPSAATAKTKASGAADDLTAISGIGPALQKKLNDYGIIQYAQIASLKAADITKLESDVIKFTGRIERDGWIAQAKSLSKKA